MKRGSIFPFLILFALRFLLTMQSPFDHELKEMLYEEYDMDSLPVDGVTDVELKFVVTGINEVTQSTAM
jgi:hypothetical protein